MAASQHNQYAPGYKPSQVRHHEWRTATNSAAHLLPHLAALSARNPHLRLLDVGAGSGTITASLAQHVTPHGTVVATDISPDILRRAEAHAAAQGVADTVEFRVADVYALPFADASFDVVHASQVLCHLDAPVEAIREMLRVAKPDGGIVALRETDMHMWCIWPSTPALLRLQDISARTIVANGGCDTGGRQLLPWALRAGAAREAITVSFGTWCYSQPEDKQAWGLSMADRMRSGQARAKALEMGFATAAELDETADAWEKWCDDDEASAGIMNGELIIKKA